MSISEETRKTRVTRWTNLKRAWESKLTAASNENDTAVAKAMIEEAEGMIKRLEIKSEDTAYPTKEVSKSSKKSKSDATKDSRKAKESTDTAGTIGL